ncbi:uncharacterized protein N7498_007681 [Penicillium cinerascens]|uniref:Uncharacterized protein n=1 Tax=Penicillium cinerascens TaxID=70096 RepID=A0A9W9ME74_9EURO|nr:uncharacterized protein N7498_007681 [Penicillium cinerascens]KAJ5198564.1 hypothetical protein N7498_007681 [Penicillium cinerascens]
MPRPDRHDQLPRLTRLINWEYLGSMTDGTDVDLASTARDYGLPILGTDSLPLPRGIPDAARGSGLFQDASQAQNFVEAPSDYMGAALEYRPIQSMESVSDTRLSRGPFHDESMSGRLQQCLHTLHSVGFSSVDEFALEYYTARLGSSPEASMIKQPKGLSTLGHLVMVLENASTRMGTVEAAGLHHGIAKAARDLYISELRAMDYTLYNPEEAEHQVGRPIRRFHLYS